jgi:acylphosphatase
MSGTRATCFIRFCAGYGSQRRGSNVLAVISTFQMRTRLSRTDSFANIKPGMISLQVFYDGNVQGVGFRWSVRHIAKGFDVTGWVRNLADGRVELQINGEEGEVRAFIDAIAQSELHALIRKQTENKLEKPVTARGFEIRYD